MISLYEHATDAWSDYFDNGFKYYSRGNFFEDFIDFYKKNYTTEYLEYVLGFYGENQPSLDVLNIPHHLRCMSKNLQIEFFDCCPTKIQKHYIDFCYKSIEEEYFQSPHSEIYYDGGDGGDGGDGEEKEEVIDLTGDMEDDEMPALIDADGDVVMTDVVDQDSDEMPELEDDADLMSAVQSHLGYINYLINNFIPVAPTVELENTEVVHPDKGDTDLYDDLFESSDEESDDDNC